MTMFILWWGCVSILCSCLSKYKYHYCSTHLQSSLVLELIRYMKTQGKKLSSAKEKQ